MLARGDRRALVNSASPLSLPTRILWLLAALVVWWLCTEFALFSTLIVPTPWSVLQAAHEIGGELLLHTGATFARGTGGFLIGSIMGVIVGAVVQYSGLIRTILEPGMDASRPVPAVALLPFLILIFGFRETGRLLLIVLSVTLFCSLATIEALAKVPEHWVRFARIAGLSRRDIFRRVLIPGTLPWLAGSFRLALALSFTITIAAEFMGAQTGLGFLINIARVNLATPTMWLAILLIGCICQIADATVVMFFSHASSWYRAAE